MKVSVKLQVLIGNNESGFLVEKVLVHAVEQLGRCSLWLILMLVLCSWPFVIVALQVRILLKEVIRSKDASYYFHKLW